MLVILSLVLSVNSGRRLCSIPNGTHVILKPSSPAAHDHICALKKTSKEKKGWSC